MYVYVLCMRKNVCVDVFVLDHVGVSLEMFFYKIELSRGQGGLEGRTAISVETFQIVA